METSSWMRGRAGIHVACESSFAHEGRRWRGHRMCGRHVHLEGIRLLPHLVSAAA
jgi:hypothetical protein